MISFFLFASLAFAQNPAPDTAAPVDTSNVQVQIDVTQAKTRKSLIAFPALQNAGGPSGAGSSEKSGEELFQIISKDLEMTGFFDFISSGAFLEDVSKTGIQPVSEIPNGFKFDSWKQIGSEFLIRGNYSVSGGEVAMDIRVYKVASESLVMAKKYKGVPSALRRIAHTFSNDLMESLTGNRGMFLSRITVASDRGGAKFKEIYLMDWDGNHIEKISSHQSVTLSPALSPDNMKVAYTAFVQRAQTKTRNADLYLYDIKTGKREPISFRTGLNSGANFSPDGSSIFLTLSLNGSSDIYKISLDGKNPVQITKGPRGAMNVEPAVSPDGKKIAFSSDRGGNPMIYVMDIDGSNATRITLAGTNNASPAWSPDGKHLAFAAWKDDHFDIMTINIDGSDLKLITSAKKKNGKGAHHESPSYSPDGRFLMYTSDRTGSSQIYISNVDGTAEQRITNDEANYFSPKWSKNIE